MLIQCFQQGQGCHMLGDAHPNGFLSRVQHDLRNITSGIENEGISPWHSALTARNTQLSIWTYWPTCANWLMTRVK